MLRLVLNRVTGVMHRVDESRRAAPGSVTACGHRITSWTVVYHPELEDVRDTAAREDAGICHRCWPPGMIAAIERARG